MNTLLREPRQGKPTRAVLRYHGGKFKLAPWIVSHFPAHRVYCEPFCGAASVLMAKPRAYVEIINDLDRRVVGLFQVLRDPQEAAELARLLRLTPYARAEYEAAFEETESPVESARRLIIRSAMGFGATAVNTDERTSFRLKWKNAWVSSARNWKTFADALPFFTERLTGVTIECLPALDMIRRFDQEDVLLYCDPPYLPLTRRMSHPSCRYRHDMQSGDHVALAELLSVSRSAVVLSGYPSEMYSELYAGWHCVSRKSHIESGQTRTECLWLNEAAARGMQGRLEI